VVEDAACAIGSEILINGAWQRIGRPEGDVVCFSLHPRKVITTGEGGMLTTNDPERDRLFRLWRQHGMTLSDLDRHSSRKVVNEAYAVVGYNYRMNDIQASIGRQQLTRLPDLIARRRALAARYAVLLADIPDLGLPVEPSWARSNWQSYCVRLPAHADQWTVMQGMLDRGIATRRGIMCAHREAPYAGTAHRHPLIESERAQERCLLLPIYADMADADQQSVAAALSDVLRAFPALRNGAVNRVHSAVTPPAEPWLGRNAVE
jgi:dTDP-4-amino-4,6-dideoxygalactose transaminase